MEDKSQNQVVPLLINSFNSRSPEPFDYAVYPAVSQALNHAASLNSQEYYQDLVNGGLASQELYNALLALDRMIDNANNINDLIEHIKTFENQPWNGLNPQERAILWKATSTAMSLFEFI